MDLYQNRINIMSKNKSTWPLEWIALILSIIVPTIDGLYNTILMNNAKDPIVNFDRKGDSLIVFEIRNDKVQMDYCNFIFPPNNDTYFVFNDSLVADLNMVKHIVQPTKSINVLVHVTPYNMIMNTKVFKYFSKLASSNNVAENKEITVPFMIDLNYHYLDIKMHAIYLAHFVFFKKNEDVIINDWGFDNVRIEKCNERDLDMKWVDTTAKEYEYISSWNYINN